MTIDVIDSPEIIAARRQYRSFIVLSRRAVADIYDSIAIMPHKGDKCCDSQKVCLINALIELDRCISGTIIKDFIQEESNA